MKPIMMIESHCVWLGRVLLLVLTIAVAPNAHALKGCSDAFEVPSNGFVFVVILDELRIDEMGEGYDPVSLADTLRHKLEINVEKLLLEENAELAGIGGSRERFVTVVCMGRMPVNNSDISGDIDGFVDEGIVLEIWGSFDSEEVAITHAVIPVYDRGAGELLSEGQVFRSSFDYDSETSWRLFLKKIMESSLPLRAYAATGVAMDRLARKEFELARKYFCKARSVLLEVKLDADNALDPDDQRLLQYVEEMSVDVISQAAEAADADEYDGILGSVEMPPGTKCEGGV